MSTRSFSHYTTPLAITAAAVLAAPLPSSAVTASASLNNISLSVVDLDLNDGIEAGYTFLEGATTVFGFSRVTLLQATVVEDFLHQPGLNSPFFSSSRSATVSGAQAVGAMTPNSLTASGSTSANGFGTSSLFEWNAGLQLTPHSQLVVSADYSLSAAEVERCPFGCGAGASAVFTVSQGGVNRGDSALSNFTRRFDGVVIEDTGPQSGTFQHLLDNAGDTASSVNVFFHVLANGGFGAPAAIPEPGTYALMLAGLGALGLISRRRNRR